MRLHLPGPFLFSFAALLWAMSASLPALGQPGPAPDEPVADDEVAPVAPVTPEAPAAEEPAPEEPAPDEELGEAAPSVRTGIAGRVLDAVSGETMIEAPVVVLQTGARVLTDLDGNFAIELRPGRYTLRSYYDLYQAARVE